MHIGGPCGGNKCCLASGQMAQTTLKLDFEWARPGCVGARGAGLGQANTLGAIWPCNGAFIVDRPIDFHIWICKGQAIECWAGLIL